MKLVLTRVMPIFVFLTTIYTAYDSINAQEIDPCDEVVIRACSSQPLIDPTGESSGGNIPPFIYSETKNAFAKDLQQQLTALTKLPEWKDIVAWVVPNLHTFQNQEVSQLVMKECSDPAKKRECDPHVIKLITFEMTLDLFLSSDLLYRKENNESGTIDTTKYFLSQITKAALDSLKMGDAVRIRNASTLMEKFKTLNKINLSLRKRAQSALLVDLDKTHKIRKTVWEDAKKQLSELVTEIENEFMTRHFDKITLRNSALETESIFNDYLLLMAPNAQYRPYSSEVVFENGLFLSNTSYFGNFFILSHELSHSVDPCFLGKPIEGMFWYKGLIKSLREGLGIKDYSTAFLKTYKRVENESAYYCAPEDEISEAAADTIASELFGRILESKWKTLEKDNRISAVAQAMRPFRCDEKRVEGETHLTVIDRYKKIVLENPRIRSFLGCKK